MHEVILFNSRRVQRVQRVQAARHALIGALLAIAGVQALLEGHGAWADAIGAVGGVVLLIAFAREVRASRHVHPDGGHDAHHGIGWVDVFAAVVTAVEAWHYHHQGKVGLPIAYGIAAVLLLALGLAHPRLQQLRRLVVSDEGFDIRMSPWRRLRAAWNDVASVTPDGLRVDVALVDGRSHRFDFSDADNGAHVAERFVAAAQRALTEASTPAITAPAPAERGPDPADAAGDAVP